jgi:hypothetical protein
MFACLCTTQEDFSTVKTALKSVIQTDGVNPNVQAVSDCNCYFHCLYHHSLTHGYSLMQVLDHNTALVDKFITSMSAMYRQGVLDGRTMFQVNVWTGTQW